jgi:HPt (histidine-containing phosphotransfer) domain-containing protein
MSDELDKIALLENVDGDLEFLAETIQMFREDTPALLSQIENAVMRRDGQALATAAHTLKGMVGNFCARATFDAALRLETMGQNGDLAGAAEAFTTLKEKTQRLETQLQEILQGN